ncbi:BQ2448_430 [Microbotryum intermedium]|uniref:BQ2448_430 protein n=1 Tax=Microbotryum intermedium TaxID=269621 RepID=A0A238F6B9_9BASI|nr:BQ2448_430 [Microbotryum intermedium]
MTVRPRPVRLPSSSILLVWIRPDRATAATSAIAVLTTSSFSSTRPHSTEASSSSSSSSTLDFLYPSFGFFSRTLPTVPLSTSSSSSSSRAPSTSSSAPYPAPSVDLITGVPIPRGTPRRMPFTTTPTSSTWRPSSNLLRSCVCGRTSACMRCRAASSSTFTHDALGGERERDTRSDSSRDALDRTTATTSQSFASDRSGPKDASSVGEPFAANGSGVVPAKKPKRKWKKIWHAQRSRRADDASTPHMNTDSTIEADTISIPWIRRFLHNSIQKFGREPISLRPVPTASHSRRGLRTGFITQLETVESRLIQLEILTAWLIEDPTRLRALELEERLDLVKLVSSFVRALKLPTPVPGNQVSIEEEKRRIVQLRHKMGKKMEDHLHQLLMDDPRHPRSRAMLWIDAIALQDRLPAVIPFDRDAHVDCDGILSKTYLGQLQQIFTHQAEGQDEQAKRQKTAEAITPILFEAWSRESSIGAEQALHLFCGWDMVNLLRLYDIANPVSSNLRRQYGELLGQLGPSPPEYYASLPSRRMRSIMGPHLVEYLATSGSTLRALQIKAMIDEEKSLDPMEHSKRLRMSASLLEGLLGIHYILDAESLATEVLQLARKLVEGGPMDDRTKRVVVHAYRMVIRSAAERGNPDRVDLLARELEQLQEAGVALEMVARSIKAVGRSRGLQDARDALSDAMEVADPTSAEDRARIVSNLVDAYVRCDDLEAATKAVDDYLLAHGDRPTLGTINSLMFGYATRHDVDSTYAIFRRLAGGEWGNRASLTPNVASYEALLCVHANVKDLDAVIGIMAKMRQEGFEMTLRAWTTLMNLYVELGQYRKAFDIFEFLERSPNPTLVPDTATFNVMLKAAVLTETPVITQLQWFQQALQRGLRPNVMTYHLLLKSVCAAGLIDVAEEMFKLMDKTPAKTTITAGEMSTTSTEAPSSAEAPASLPIAMSDVRPDVFTFSILLNAYIKTKQSAKAQACLEEMRSRGIEPTSVTFGIIVASMIAGPKRSSPTNREKAKTFARNFLALSPLHVNRKDLSKNAKRDKVLARGDELVHIFAPILQAEAKTANGQTVLDTFKLVLENGARPSIELYTILMDAFQHDAVVRPAPGSSAMGVEDVVTVWNGLHGSILDAYGYPVRIKRLSPLLPSIFSNHLKMPSPARRISPAHSADLCLPVSILIDTLSSPLALEAGHGRGISRIWGELSAEGFRFDAATFNTLVRAFIRQGEMERAAWIIERILLARSDEASEAEVEERFSSAERTFWDIWISRTQGNSRMAGRIASASRRLSMFDSDQLTPVMLREFMSRRSELEPMSSGTFVEAMEMARVEKLKRVWNVYNKTWNELDEALANGRMGENDLERMFPVAVKGLQGWRARRVGVAA